MKLVCISVFPQIYNQTHIRVGCVYEVMERNGYESEYKLVYVKCDSGNYQEYPRRFFITLEEFRNSKIDNILGDKD